MLSMQHISKVHRTDLVETHALRDSSPEVNDREFVAVTGPSGSGMPEKVLKSALLPFYSTKQKGSGLGLPLCREIIEAHGGRLSLANRRDGGLLVELSIPAKVEVNARLA